MKIDEKVIERFNQLIETATEIIQNHQIIVSESSFFGAHSYQKINEEKAFQWRLNCLQIIENSYGKNNHYYLDFERNSIHDRSIHYDYVKNSLGILKAAKDDYENGYLFNARTLIEAEIFDDLLEQSEELLKKAYFQAAAIIAGCVLEDSLRKLCDRNSILLPPKATIEPMNIELAKQGFTINSGKRRLLLWQI